MRNVRARRLSVLLAPLALAALILGVACGDDDDDGDQIEFQTPAGETATATTPAGETATVAGQQPPETETTSPATTEEPGATTLTIETTQDDPLAFTKDTLEAPAATEITVEYTNSSTTPHNIHFFEGDDASAPSLGMTEIATGPDATETVTFTTPDTPGSYFFHCDVHPTQMQGELVVS